ncbi:hypothetical protein IB242_04515 [Xanthomonas sp. XNM01]|nr:hypothetical protein [Xanthomonas sp. XNM01]
MPNSPPSSPISAPCRLEWRPSRWLGAILLSLSVLAPLSVLASGLPRAAAWPLAAAVGVGGLYRWRVERARPPAVLVLPPGAQPATFDGIELRDVALAWRGRLAFVVMRTREGRRTRRVWWPDTLPAASRRELRLAVRARQASRPPPPVAP